MSTVPSPHRPGFSGGTNIALKVPPHQWEQTVAFYRDTLGLEQIDNPYTAGPPSVGFAFGSNRLWVDRVPTLSQAELWLELTTTDTTTAAEHLAATGTTRCDEIEPLGESPAFWISNPAGIVHLVATAPEDT